MDIAISNIVQSTAGRDKDSFFFVIDKEGEFLYLADGKQHRVENAKKKRMKHVKFYASAENDVAEKIRNKEKIYNIELRKAIAAYCGGNENQEG